MLINHFTVVYLFRENLDASAVIYSVYFLVLDWIALSPNTNCTGFQVNGTPEDLDTVPWYTPEFRKHTNEGNRTYGSDGPWSPPEAQICWRNAWNVFSLQGFTYVVCVCVFWQFGASAFGGGSPRQGVPGCGNPSRSQRERGLLWRGTPGPWPLLFVIFGLVSFWVYNPLTPLSPIPVWRSTVMHIVCVLGDWGEGACVCVCVCVCVMAGARMLLRT